MLLSGRAGRSQDGGAAGRERGAARAGPPRRVGGSGVLTRVLVPAGLPGGAGTAPAPRPALTASPDPPPPRLSAPPRHRCHPPATMDPQSDTEGGSSREPSLELLSRAPAPCRPPPPQVSVEGPAEACGERRGPGLDAAARERQLQRELLALKQQQQLQKQLLFAEFQKQHEHLTRQHEVQLQKHLKQQQEALAARRQQELEQQRAAGAAGGAIASTEVKLKLQEFLLSKTKEPGTGPPNHFPPPAPQMLGSPHLVGPEFPPPNRQPGGHPHPTNSPLLGTYDGRDDFPLRKTASEPNLKVRSRFKTEGGGEEEQPPAAEEGRHRHQHLQETRHRDHGVPRLCSSAPGSGPSSPNSSHSAIAENGLTGSVPNIHAEQLLPQHRALTLDGASQLSLYTSPSLPNISLGLQATVTVTNSHLNASPKLSPQAEAERPAVATPAPRRRPHRQVPEHLVHPGLPSGGGPGRGGTPPAGPASLLQHVLLLEQARQQSTLIAVPLHGQSPLVTGERAGSVRTVSKLPRHRPLSRTQSSPLPQSPQALPHGALPHGALPHGALQHHFLDKQQVQLGKLLPKAGELARQPPHPPRGDGGGADGAAVAPPGGRASPRPPPSPSSPRTPGTPRSGRRTPRAVGCPARSRGTAGMRPRSPGSPTSPSWGVTYKQVFPEAPLQLYPAPPPGHPGAAPPGPRPHPVVPRQRWHQAPRARRAPQAPLHHRRGVRHLHAEAPVRLREHQHPPRARRPHPEHLVPAAGDRPPRQVRGRRRWRRFRRCTRSITRCSTAPAPSTARNSTARSSWVPSARRCTRCCPAGASGWTVTRCGTRCTRPAPCAWPWAAWSELAFKVAAGEIKNGFAVIRPPGHHAEESTAMGFCFFNSVAISAKLLQQKLSVGRILIVDWDIHHGNGTQQAFYSDPDVLYISLHRYDDGNFFPGSGAPEEVGSGMGVGYNINIAWTGGVDPPIGDVEYLTAFRTVVMPIANEFSPDVVLVSAGFDAVEGHLSPLGGYSVTAKCFGHLTKQLMMLAGGPGGAGAGGGARPDGHLRRLGGLRLRSARPGAGAPGSVPPAAEAKCERGGHPGEGHRDPEPALGLGEALRGGRGLLLAGGTEGGGRGGRDGDSHGPALGGGRAGEHRPPAQAGGGADGGRAHVV
ncbi:unnamed protein product, partial [Bubo scandiacus]